MNWFRLVLSDFDLPLKSQKREEGQLIHLLKVEKLLCRFDDIKEHIVITTYLFWYYHDCISINEQIAPTLLCMQSYPPSCEKQLEKRIPRR